MKQMTYVNNFSAQGQSPSSKFEQRPNIVTFQL